MPNADPHLHTGGLITIPAGMQASTQLTRGIHPMLFQCWVSIEYGGPTLKRHWANASCLLGRPNRNYASFK